MGYNTAWISLCPRRSVISGNVAADDDGHLLTVVSVFIDIRIYKGTVTCNKEAANSCSFGLIVNLVLATLYIQLTRASFSIEVEVQSCFQ